VDYGDDRGSDDGVVYITRDGGETWRIFNLGEPAAFFVWDPLDPNVLYARAGGLMRSGDGGVTWKRILPRAETIEEIGTPAGTEPTRVAPAPAAPSDVTTGDD
jgi:photosystem II stability/assembly factor-like uncharacterized protein